MHPEIAIVIPARYASTRFPGKPLAKIGPKTLLQHTSDAALGAARILGNTTVIVATEDRRIFEHAQSIAGITPVMTTAACLTGSDRVLAALDVLRMEPAIVVNLQADAPFTPSQFIVQIAQCLRDRPQFSVATPAAALTWGELERLRWHKQSTPFSGTTVVMTAEQRALWFSKNIIPALRGEHQLRQQHLDSPVYQHIGLYGFQLSALRLFVRLPESPYEKLEGLEQLRLLEHGVAIRIEKVVHSDKSRLLSGIDTPQDLQQAIAWWTHTRC